MAADPRDKVIGEVAKKRLSALSKLPSLGAGSGLAAHDLELRGAGEMLGEGQSGHIEAIGFALYNELLGRAIEMLRDGCQPDNENLSLRRSEIDLGGPALLPESYPSDVSLRLQLYRQIGRADGPSMLGAIENRCTERDGAMPIETARLFTAARCRLLCDRAGIRSMHMGLDGSQINGQGAASWIGKRLQRLVKDNPGAIRWNHLTCCASMCNARASARLSTVPSGSLWSC